MRESFATLLRTGAGKLALSLLVASSPTAAFTFKSVPSPNLNLNDLGRIAFTGDFDSISLYQYEGQSQQYPGRDGALLSRYPNGVFATINVTDADIKAMCSLQVKGAERVVFAGNFTGVGNMTTPGGIALLDPTNGTVQALTGLTGSVNTLYCDRSAGQVYVGGALTGSKSSNAIVWKDGWQDLSFEGFNGPVQSIVKAPNGNIIFGGEFNGLGGNATVAAENSTQIIPISNANISAQTSSGLPGLTDPTKIACKANFATQGTDQTWLLSDNSPGFWKAEFGFGFEPTSLKLYNTDYEGRGSKTFRFTALPDGGIMNFSYVDPNGQQAFCDARCPLPEGNTTAQDFTFVNVVGMNAFRVDISDWYGAGAGLNGIQLFQDAMYSYAVNDFNEPKGCGPTTSRSEATSTGSWQITPSHNSYSQYLTTVLQGEPIDTNAATVTFFPDIKQSGNYSVTIYTPGCQGDGTCGSRGRVNVTATMGGKSEDTILWQTNTFDKYDEIYNGFIDATGGSRPQVVIRPAPQQGPTPLTMVAQRVRFTLLKATSGNLNGLFEYKPGTQLDKIDLADSVINAAGASLTPREKAPITSLATDGQNLYVGGNFSTDDGRNNVFSVRQGSTEPSSLPGNGLNSQVMTLFHNDSTLYVGGNFTNTKDNNAQGLNGVAALTNNQWRPLGAGVDGVVLYLVPFSLNITANTPEQVLAVSGFFSRVNAFDNNPATRVVDFAVWVPSRGNWLHNLDFYSLAMSGRLMTYADVPGSDRWFGGSVSSGALLASGTAELKSDDDLALHAFPVDVQAQQEQVTTRKRAIVEGQNMNTTGIRTGTFYKQNGMNKTILAGHFATTGTDGQNITNVLIIDGNDSDKVTGFGDELHANSTFAAVAVQDNVLYAGGMVTGQLNNNRVAGIVAYDLAGNKFTSIQPPPLQGVNVTVNAIAPRPKSKDIYVAGQFLSAGALSCDAVCVWNTERSQWTRPGNDLSGEVSSLTWVADTKLLIAGNLTSGNNQTTILSYDSSSNQFAVIAGASDLPGPVTALTIATNSGDELWAAGQSSDGKAYLQRFDGGKWMPVNQAMFGENTDIRAIQVLSLSEDHGNSDIIDKDQDLLLMGQINIANFGSASAALFNGTTLIPFLLATKGQDGSTEPGSLSSIFVENPNSFFRQSRKHLALWAIVLIGLAIALLLTFLLVVAGIVIEWYRKKAQGYSRAPQSYPDRLGNVGRLPPEQLFGTLSGPRAPAI
ncbi:cortical protein marker for cell polarity-domain-containing protein [Pyrenochaeta sp. MPI-SDFR-AT-0127]|nr:cortical protein marker for cell polarity-domain-containing protein [Pyrenochaeta sp. MPI-SDFR-AT-0127]